MRELVQREAVITRAQRWEDFRARRQKLVDKYIACRKKQDTAETVAKLVFTVQILHKLQHNYAYAQYMNEVRLKASFMTLIIKNLWKKRGWRYGGKEDTAHEVGRRRVKNILSLLGTVGEKAGIARAQAVLKPFVEEVCYRERMKELCRVFYTRVVFMQKKIKSQIVIRDAKVEVLVQYWDKVFGQLQKKASKSKDNATNKLCKKIILVNKVVQRHILMAFVNKCRELHSIAFLQWR